MPVLRVRKARDEDGKCGNQSADESVINRRPIGSRHPSQVEIITRRCKLGDGFLCVPTPMTIMRAQYVGRLHRLHDGKKDVLVVDYVDNTVPVLARMAARRRAGYRALGYMIE